MNYKETLDYMFSQLPMFQRIGKAAYKANLNNTLALDAHFNHPHSAYRTIHVAGTNGKGSTSHMLASVLMAAGYKVGLYTSPHLVDFRERIKVDGIPISQEFVVDFVKSNQSIFERIKPSFFEMTVAMAFEYFKQEAVDIAVVEVGLGGRLDSTNIITPILSIITNIGLDHTDLLGDTLQKIAAEKAGIIKADVPVVISQTQKEVKRIFRLKAKTVGSEIAFADEVYKVMPRGEDDGLQHLEATNMLTNSMQTLSVDLMGNYQRMNITGVLCALDRLNERGFSISQEQLAMGLSSVIKSTGLMGRWQTIGQSPRVICDTGHNVDGISQIVKQISNTPFQRLHMVIGMVGDKNIDGMLHLLPKNAFYYFTRASITRALDENELKSRAVVFGLQGNSYKSIRDAIAAAKRNADTNDLIFVGGSTFVVADALS